MRIGRTSIVAVLATLAGLVAFAQPAMADTTHKFLRQFSLPNGAQPFGVDKEGNIYVWREAEHTVGKYSPDGKPVDFSALGENTIDGIGGGHCSTVPSDCDEVPTNGFTEGADSEIAQLDTSGGPANGDIYVAVHQNFGGQDTGIDRVYVFDHGGKYLGEIDQSQAAPLNCFAQKSCGSDAFSIAPNGHIFIFYTRFGSTQNVDEYVPIDGNPAHDAFSNQLHAEYVFNGSTAIYPQAESFERGFASDNYLYSVATDGNNFFWYKTPTSEFGTQKGEAVPLDFSPEPTPFHEFGTNPPEIGAYEGGNYEEGVVDPATQNVYLFFGDCCPRFGRILEFNENNEQIGPPFGELHVGGVRSLAIDNSGGTHNGEIYVPGEQNSGIISVYSPPIPVPDLTLDAPQGRHTTATLGGTVDLAGGPPVTECKVDYGPLPTANFFTNELVYKHHVPCSPAPPYSGPTHVTGELSGLEASAEYHYRIVVRTANGTNKATPSTFRTEAVLGVKTGAAVETTTSATKLSGEVNPDGIDTKVYFEYGVDTTYGDKTPVADVGEGGGEAAIPEVAVGKLQAGRTYHYRLVAENNLGTSYGADRTFRMADKPGIFGVASSDLTGGSAVLRARIDTVGYDTSYHFEYGTSTAYGESVPVPDEVVSGSSTAQSVSVHISGLDPGATYHYRVVASNKWGTTVGNDTTFSFLPPVCPNALVRQQTSAARLPDCRAYELVSPGEAGSLQMFAGDSLPNASRAGVDIAGPPPNTGKAESPSRFGFHAALGAAPGTHPANTLLDLYVATRTGHGWVTTYPGLPANQAVVVVEPHCSSDLSQCYDTDYGEVLGKDPTDTGSHVPYLWNVDGASAGRLPTTAESVPGAGKTEGAALASADFTHFAFSSRTIRFAPGGVIGAPGSAYDNDISANTVTLISKRADGTAIPRESTNTNTKEFMKIPFVSNDGSHILMSTAAAPPCTAEEPSECPPELVHLYMRVDDMTTYDVSGGHDVQYVGATSDGRKVFFLSDEHLSAADTDTSTDLYEWSEATDSINLISAGSVNGNSNACNASWTTQCGVQPVISNRPDLDSSIASETGEIYFYSPEQLEEANPGFKNQRNLYVYREGKPQYVTTLDPGSKLSRLQISPDGTHTAFITDSKLTSYDNAGYDEMYSYSAVDGELECVSCVPDGSAPTGDVRGSASGRFITNDGRTFFSTRDALVQEDTNGLYDVYEFVDGRPQLISSGTGSQDSFGGGLIIYPASKTGLEAVSPSGRDVYFSTFDTLVPEDHNGSFFKFYDARTAGGFLANPPIQPCTAADECHGESSSPPAEPQIGTQSALGSGGNATAPPKRSRRHSGKHRRHHGKRHHRRHREAAHRG